MKRKILILPDGNFLAHTTRSYEIAKVLKKRNYSITFAGEGPFLKIPAAEGFKVVSLKTLDPEHVMKRCLAGRMDFYDYESIASLVREEMDLYSEVKPDMVLSDFRYTAGISCELTNIPLAVLMNASWTNYYAVKPKLTEDWIKRLPRVMVMMTEMFTLPFVSDYLFSLFSTSFKKFRKDHGLSRRKNMWDMLRGDLNLITDIPQYGPTKNLPENFHYIGPLTWNAVMKPPAWLKKLNPKKPVIYITMGSTGDLNMFEMAIDLFGNTDYQVIMTTAGLKKFDKLPKNIYSADLVPGEAVMKKSDMVICQGGNGTIYQAMIHGLPIIGIPRLYDQEFNLRRVEDLGIGIYVKHLGFKPEHLMIAVNEILTENKYREQSLYYQNICKEYNAPCKAADLIGSFLK